MNFKTIRHKLVSWMNNLFVTAVDAISTVLAKAVTFFANPRFSLALFLLFVGVGVFAQNAAGNYETGITAIETVTQEIVKYVPVVQKLCYAIAGVVAIVGAISVYIAMNNDEQDVKKKIMITVGSCIFLIAAAQALPLFFGVENGGGGAAG